MTGEAEKKLYAAARTGDVLAFQEVLYGDPHLLLASFSFSSSNKTPLHIATMHGMTSIVETALDINAQLALDLDSTNSSSLHIAAAHGSLEIVKKLLSVAPETRWWRDCHGMNPVHIAAMKGHVEILKELLLLDFFPAMERVHRGQTVLHLCVKHGQLPALKVLEEYIGELVCVKDDDGETILHLAVRCKQLETIRYLAESKIIDKQTQNSMGKTALDILNQTPMFIDTYTEMRKNLTKLYRSSTSSVPKLIDMVMVIMVLIATMAFQATVSPPGGVWQDDGTKESPHRTGEAVMASTHPSLYMSFVGSNFMAFVAAFVSILLIIFGQLSRSFIFLFTVGYAIGMSMVAIGISYGVSVAVTAPSGRRILPHMLGLLASQIIALFVMALLLKRLLKRH